MDLTIIAAVSENNVIGNNGKVPWHIKKDSERFKRLTLDHPVIMGRKTYESLPDKFRPLPQRKNIVLSRTLESQNRIYVARNIREALQLTENQDTYVIGGSEIYRMFLGMATRMEITRVHAHFEGDAFFPLVNSSHWNMINKEKNLSLTGIPYSFLTYVRR